MSKYDFTAIEAKWQRYWAEHDTFHAEDDYTKPKFYALVEFPYPSGQGLHIGHPRPYTAMDVVSRKRRMEGYNVLFPMGWDAFGLPTENYAIKHKIHPAIVTANNVARFKSQLQALGMSFDWDREINTTDPNYFHWTQWIFLQMFKKGLAYKKETAVNWCTSCKVVLANEEVVGGVCERCGGEVVQKVKSQWMLKITEYAQRLLDDLDEVDYLEKIKTAQRNWIGRSTGAEVDFQTTAGDALKIYTTRPDTLFGATYMVISPEHPLIEKWADKLENMDEIRAYQEKAAKKSDFERTEMAKEKTGVCLKGVRGINPVNDKEIPIFVSDYVLMSYGTGAIMAVPAHDTRDYEFAKVFDLPIIEVVKGGDVTKEAFTDCATGTMVNSGFLDGMSVEDAKVKIKGWLEATGKGKSKGNYKLRDWVFSRQRYWGEPIPVVYCDKCGWVGLPESELPLTLPDVESYMPTDTGESPLSTLESFIKSGAMDGLPGTRKQKCMVCGSMVDQKNKEKKNTMEGQMSLFDFAAEEDKKSFQITFPNVGEYSREEYLAYEKEMLGVYVSGHPLEEYIGTWEKNVTAKSSDFVVDEETGSAVVHDGAYVTIGGMITEKTVKTTRNNKMMAFLTVEDLAGSVEVLVFPKDYEKRRDMLIKDEKVFIRGRASVGDEPVGKLICEQIIPFSQVPRELWIQYADKDAYLAGEKELLDLLKTSDGNDTVIIYLGRERAKKVLPRNWNVRAGEALVTTLSEMLGEKNVKVVEKPLGKISS